MKNYFFLSLLIILFSTTLSSAENNQQKVISLKDGSTLKGEILSMKSNIYTVKTSALGEIKINQEDIANIGSNQPQENRSVSPSMAVAPTDPKLQMMIRKDFALFPFAKD